MGECRIGRKDECLIKGCQWSDHFGVSCSLSNKAPIHYFASSKGLTTSSSYVKKEDRSNNSKYLGYTTDKNFPKKLNTGRILYKPKSKKAAAIPKN